MANTISKMMGAGLAPLTALQIGGDFQGGVTAAGATQGTATAIFADNVVVSNVATGTGVILPSNRQPSDDLFVINQGANALLVYPPVGGTIGLGATNAGLSVPSGKTAHFVAISATGWAAVVSA